LTSGLRGRTAAIIAIIPHIGNIADR